MKKTIRTIIGAAMAIAPRECDVVDIIIIATHIAQGSMGDPSPLEKYLPSPIARALSWARAALEYLPDHATPPGAVAASVLGRDLPEAVRRCVPVLMSYAAQEKVMALGPYLDEVDAIAALADEAGGDLDAIAELLGEHGSHGEGLA